MVTHEEIQKVAQQIAEEFRPERVILFGSYAYGVPNADSDVDILVVMPHEGRTSGWRRVVKPAIWRVGSWDFRPQSEAAF